MGEAIMDIRHILLARITADLRGADLADAPQDLIAPLVALPYFVTVHTGYGRVWMRCGNLSSTKMEIDSESVDWLAWVGRFLSRIYLPHASRLFLNKHTDYVTAPLD